MIENKQIDLYDMINNLEQEDEYTNRVVFIQTQFAGKYIAPLEGGFQPTRFIGTRKEYDMLMEIHYPDHSCGKVLDVIVEEYTEPEPEKKWENIYNSTPLKIKNVNPRYYNYL
jgi:hypothetical protein